MKIPAINPQPSAIRYAAAYSSNSVIAAGSTSQVFSAASNANGAYVWKATAYSTSAAAPSLGLLAKATAPTTIIDGDLINQMLSATAGAAANMPDLPRPIFIPPGKGLFFFLAVLETGAARSVLYTLL